MRSDDFEATRMLRIYVLFSQVHSWHGALA